MLAEAPVKLSSYIHLEEIPLNIAIQIIVDNLEEAVKAFRVPMGAYEVHVTSLRLRTFAHKGTVCYICGAKATHFSVDRFRNKSDLDIPHMNLWGVREDGTELLFTHDHVLSRGMGGKDVLENAEPCCTDCNNVKSRSEGPGRLAKK